MSHEDPDKPIADQRQANLDYGRNILEKQGINPDDYAKYFEIMAANDVPVINKLPNFNFIRNLETLTGWERTWSELKHMYDGISDEGQDKNTGREIILEMKRAIEKLDTDFREYVNKCREANVIVPVPGELVNTRSQIVELAHRYTDEVPAYVAYRWYGRFTLDLLGRRRFQINEHSE